MKKQCLTILVAIVLLAVSRGFSETVTLERLTFNTTGQPSLPVPSIPYDPIPSNWRVWQERDVGILKLYLDDGTNTTVLDTYTWSGSTPWSFQWLVDNKRVLWYREHEGYIIESPKLYSHGQIAQLIPDWGISACQHCFWYGFGPNFVIFWWATSAGNHGPKVFFTDTMQPWNVDYVIPLDPNHYDLETQLSDIVSCGLQFRVFQNGVTLDLGVGYYYAPMHPVHEMETFWLPIPVPERGSLCMLVRPEAAGINTVTPAIGTVNTYCQEAVPIHAARFLYCPYVWRFDHWEGDGIADPNSPDSLVEINGNQEITAVFADDRKCGDECHPNFLEGDLNHDCLVNLADMAILTKRWLQCTLPECD